MQKFVNLGWNIPLKIHFKSFAFSDVMFVLDAWCSIVMMFFIDLSYVNISAAGGG